MTEDLIDRITYHLSSGGLFNPELADHLAVRNLLMECREALAQPEPVAWVSSEELLVMRGNALGGAKDWRINVGLVKQDGDVGLYTTPPQRKPLTDEEIWDEVKAADLDWQTGWSLDEDASNRYITFARAIEAAHGIKGEA